MCGFERAARAIAGLLQLTRPLTCLGTALLVVMGAYLAGPEPLALTIYPWRAAGLVALIAAACNVLNDYRDVAVDRLNRPWRPIPAGRVSSPLVGGWALLLAAGAAALAWGLDARLAAVATGLGLLGAAYSFFFKNTVLFGNALVGLLCASPVAYGAALQGGLTRPARLATLFVFLFVLAREILGTVVDGPGDARAGLRTITTRLGRAAALRLFRVIGLLLVGLCLAPALLRQAPGRYLWVAVPTLALPMLGIVVWLGLRSTPAAVHRARQIMKLQWFAGLLAMAWLK
ncbi:MAG: UbiA family prenyltransferase [Anaerolineales bacterium]|nr:UbiA family prenyltransferase [Anaerolineales bacterium]